MALQPGETDMNYLRLETPARVCAAPPAAVTQPRIWRRPPVNSQRSMRWSGLAWLALSLATLASGASANVRLNLEASGDTGVLPRPSFVGSEDIQISGSVSDGGSTAQGSANLDTGLLRASAVSVGGGGIATSAQSVIAENFRFSTGASGTAFLDWSVDGSASADPSSLFSYGQGSLAFYWVTPESAQGQELLYVYTTWAYICDAIQVETSCEIGNSFAAAGTLALSILPGDYTLQVALTTQAANGTADFGNTARLHLRLPEGVSIESDSGTFLASAVPISAVPEPAAAALLLAGLGVVVLAGRRGRSR